MLRSLGWDLADPGQMTEEARSWDENNKRLYFDYLGLNRQFWPVLMVEAKGVDAEGPRRPRKTPPNGEDMAALIAEALRLLHTGDTPNGLLQQWIDWLISLRTYVRSIDPEKRSTLQRVVITSGQWLIVFTNPVATLVTDASPNAADIRCFVSFEDLELRHGEIYRLLARPRLVNTLPLVLELPEALGLLDPAAIDALYRGVVVTTKLSGAERSPYPTRTVYPAVVLISAGRSFAVADFGGDQLEEPRKVGGLSDFLAALQTRGDQFQGRVLNRLGRPDLPTSAVTSYPTSIYDAAEAADDPPVPTSTTAMVAANTPERPQLVRTVGERPSDTTYLVITGEEWFHKRLKPFGPECGFHSFLVARNERVSAGQAKAEVQPNSFTTTPEQQHCEHVDILGLRQNLCQVQVIETHLCCRVCVFYEVCWPTAEDRAKLPCAP